MTGIIHIFRQAIEGGLSLFDHLPPVWALILITILTGTVLLWIVRYTTPQKWVERSRARMTSAIYETRLFLDDPLRVLIAQGRLLIWSLAYIGAMLPALVLVAVPLGLVYLHLDARFGLEPLPIGQDFVVRVETRDAQTAASLALEKLPSGLSLTAPVVRAPEIKKVFLRLRADRQGEFDLSFTTTDRPVAKRLTTRVGAPISVEKISGAAVLWAPTLEAPLPDGHAITTIKVAHAGRTDTWLGMPWWLFWLLLATAAALALKRPMGVAL